MECQIIHSLIFYPQISIVYVEAGFIKERRILCLEFALDIFVIFGMHLFGILSTVIYLSIIMSEECPRERCLLKKALS
jgi:hypothetical protein